MKDFCKTIMFILIIGLLFILLLSTKQKDREIQGGYIITKKLLNAHGAVVLREDGRPDVRRLPKNFVLVNSCQQNIHQQYYVNEITILLEKFKGDKLSSISDQLQKYDMCVTSGNIEENDHFLDLYLSDNQCGDISVSGFIINLPLKTEKDYIGWKTLSTVSEGKLKTPFSELLEDNRKRRSDLKISKEVYGTSLHPDTIIPNAQRFEKIKLSDVIKKLAESNTNSFIILFTLSCRGIPMWYKENPYQLTLNDYVRYHERKDIKMYLKDKFRKPSEIYSEEILDLKIPLTIHIVDVLAKTSKTITETDEESFRNELEEYLYSIYTPNIKIAVLYNEYEYDYFDYEFNFINIDMYSWLKNLFDLMNNEKIANNYIYLNLILSTFSNSYKIRPVNYSTIKDTDIVVDKIIIRNIDFEVIKEVTNEKPKDVYQLGHFFDVINVPKQITIKIDGKNDIIDIIFEPYEDEPYNEFMNKVLSYLKKVYKYNSYYIEGKGKLYRNDVKDLLTNTIRNKIIIFILELKSIIIDSEATGTIDSFRNLWTDVIYRELLANPDLVYKSPDKKSTYNFDQFKDFISVSDNKENLLELLDDVESLEFITWSKN